MFNKKGFTLAELMVVIAIIGMLTASAMTIFGGAQAQARDARRIADLNTISSALENYYIKNRFYPQPAKRTNTNLWGYNDVDAIATCPVKMKKNEETGELIDEIDYNGISCGGNIYVTKKGISSLTCNYEITRADGNTEEDSSSPDTDDVYEGNNLIALCNEYYEDSGNGLMQAGDAYKVTISDIDYDSSDVNKILIGWKGTLTEKSGKNSRTELEPDNAFYGFLKDQGFDPKYTSSKYKDYGLGNYIYSAFRDNVGTNSSAKSRVGATAYQIGATFEKQDDEGNFHPETLIIGNYKRPSGTKGYPISLFGNGKNVIVNGQKEGEKAKYVSRPNGSTNTGVPYPVEEIE